MTSGAQVRVAVVIMALLVVACSPVATKGTMPPPGPAGEVDPSSAPDFIAVAGRDEGVAGYVRKEYLVGDRSATASLPNGAPWPVYAEDLQTLIGHMVPGKGFVPLGVDPRIVPNLPVQQGASGAAPLAQSGALTLYVRNAAAQTAWFAVLDRGNLIGGQGYNPGLVGVGCVDVNVGSQLVMVDRAPQNSGVGVIRVVYSRLNAAESPTLWVDIAAAGAVTQGEGVPAWWPDPAQPC